MPTDANHLLSAFDRLISIPSISSANAALDTSNRPVIEHLAEQLEALGFRCEMITCSESGPEKLNLIATRGTGPGGLILAGHTDTVPLDAALWSVDPFRVTERDGKLYGLGVTDMKGFFALVMAAVQPLLEAEFIEPLIILATADEETSMQGARHLVELGRPRARAALIGEPTSLQPVRAHKGVMMESIRLLGRSGHSSNPALGNSALDAMHAVITELMQYRGELRERYYSDLFELPYPTLNLGSIHGGDNPNRICGHCNLEFDIRLLPGMHIESLREEIRERIRRVTEPLDMAFDYTPLFAGAPSFQATNDSPILRTVESLTGHGGIAVGFATEAPFLQEMGIDTIVMGPGNIDQAHQPDEYMSITMIEPCIELIRKLITQHCLKSGNP